MNPPVIVSVSQRSFRAVNNAHLRIPYIKLWRGIRVDQRQLLLGVAGKLMPGNGRMVVAFQGPMKVIDVRTIDVSFERLNPIAGPVVPPKKRDVVRCQIPLKLRQRRRLCRGPHVGPDDSVPLPTRIGAQSDLFPELALR